MKGVKRTRRFSTSKNIRNDYEKDEYRGEVDRNRKAYLDEDVVVEIYVKSVRYQVVNQCEHFAIRLTM